MKKTLKYKKPRREYLVSLGTMKKDTCFSSCRSDAPSKTVLQKISSEAKEIKGVSKDEIQGLLQIFDNQSKEDTLASFPVFKEA